MPCTLQTPSAFITSRPDPRMFSLVYLAQEAEMSLAVHFENSYIPVLNLC